MYRSISVRIEGVLAEPEREKLSRAITSLGGRVVSLHARADVNRTYVLGEVPESCEGSALAHAAGAHRIDDPALLVVEVFPRERALCGALEQALGGAGGPAGVLAAMRTAEGVLVEFDAARGSFALLADVIDVELERAPGRRIVPVLPFSDTVLTALARDFLNDPAIDVSRLIETYTEPLL